MENRIKIFALFGESGAGKDTIQRWVVSHVPNTKGIVSCTTRPKRDYENDGKDYHFLTADKFAEKILDGSMLEATCFNDWHYGTALEELDPEKINIGVFNIQGIECLLEDPRLWVIPVYVFVRDKERLIRVLNREEEPNCLEVCRRFQTDYKDFAEIDFEYRVINNNGVAIEGDRGKQDAIQSLLTLFG
jgi:guanylate kinase